VTRRRRQKNLVLCEDTGATLDYLKQSFGSNREDKVNIVFKGIGRGPVQLLREAKTALNPNNRKHGRNNDFVFLIFDRDEHVNFDETVNEIKQHNKISAFATSPCFEYFWALHYNYTTAVYSSKKQCDEIKTAISHCRRAREAYATNQSTTPFSDMDLLIEYIDRVKSSGVSGLSNIKTDKRFYPYEPE